MARRAMLRRILDKSPRTILYRGRQELRLRLTASTRGWARLQNRIASWATAPAAEDWLNNAPFSVFSPQGSAALKKAAEGGLLDPVPHVRSADAIMQRDFSLFEAALPGTGPWPWNQDWRTGYIWHPASFRSYVHPTPGSPPSDVKFPWELSRLAFLPSLVQADILDGGSHRTRQAFEILKDWSEGNPMAHSVNWYPMEAAMRAIALCMLADMARQKAVHAHEASLLLRMLAEHGEFVARTLEVTDHAGNHLAAELVALLLIGRTLQGTYPRATQWARFAEHRIPPEIPRQFLPDGVNFEKATAYHRLVLSLFLLGSIALERAGRPLGPTETARLQAAARYNAFFLRPDSLCPLVGDSDDAQLFYFDHRPVRDHRADIAVAAVHLHDVDLQPLLEGELPPSVPWLFGPDALSTRRRPPSRNPSLIQGCRYFPDGGVLIARNEKNYLFWDIGEVGQNGLGGHGHNDLLSFELFLNGSPFLVDPGSYLYSGDLPAHDRFRSTKAHNSLVVDGEEIAPFRGRFRIANNAQPVDVRVQYPSDTSVLVSAGHTGYHRLSDPVTHHRTLRFDPRTGTLLCQDQLRARGEHLIARYFHFAPGILPALGRSHARVQHPERGPAIILRWSDKTRATLIDDEVSPSFGCRQASKTLVLHDHISTGATFSLEIYPVDAPERRPSQS